MPEPETMPMEFYEEYYEKFFGECGPVDDVPIGASQLVESRKPDIEDTFYKLREGVGVMLGRMGIEDSVEVDRVTTYISFQERYGFESGVRFVFDRMHVSTPQEAARRSSVMHSMKTAGVQG
jgi:hypothetical protein